MKLKIFIYINLFVIIALFISAYYFIAWRQSLYDNFFRVGWENYDGVSLRTPANYFSKLLMASTFFTLYTGIQLFKQEKTKTIGVLLSIVAILSLLLGMIILGGGVNLSTKQSWTWQTLFLLNIIISIFALLRIQMTQKTIPQPFHDILDDVNSITHQDESENDI